MPDDDGGGEMVQEQFSFDPAVKTESLVQFNARFSTIMSDREQSNLNERSAFFNPRSFSQAINNGVNANTNPNTSATITTDINNSSV